MNYNIKILVDDLKLSDHELFLKLYDEICAAQEIKNYDELDQEITRAINIQKGRRICECGGTGFFGRKKCFLCNGKGYNDLPPEILIKEIKEIDVDEILGKNLD